MSPEPEDQLARTLHTEAERYLEHGGADVELSHVLARAGQIRRGRRMRASMVMAAVVVAVAVPAGLVVVNHDPDRGTAPPPIAGSTGPTNTEPPLVSTSDTPTQGAGSPAKPITLGGVTAGAAPSTGYEYAGTLHGPNGDQPLGKGGNPRAIARIDGGFLVARTSLTGGASTVSYVADDRTSGPGVSWPYGTSGFAVSPEGNVGAFIEPDGTVLAVQDAGSRYFEVGKLPTGSSYQAEAVMGENCSGRSAEVGCTVYARSDGASPEIWAISPNVAAHRVLPGITDLAGMTADGAYAGVASTAKAVTCSESRDNHDDVLFRTCAWRFLSFSPDGSYLLATGAGDVDGENQLEIVEAASGKVLLHLRTAPDVTLYAITWEDHDHVLATVFDQGQWGVERIGLDGSREMALAPVQDDGSGNGSPYLLPQN
ncbi:MAG: hypothetical protein JWP74_1974 [Marmoricola sp.]|nr:hypothetical protein [Marmoricola sp.]